MTLPEDAPREKEEEVLTRVDEQTVMQTERATAAEDVCGAQHRPEGWLARAVGCTEKPGHPGPHVAGGSGCFAPDVSWPLESGTTDPAVVAPIDDATDRPRATDSAALSLSISEDALLREARKALKCLYIAVESSVADDVNAKVEAALHALVARVEALQVENQQLRQGVTGDRPAAIVAYKAASTAPQLAAAEIVGGSNNAGEGPAPDTSLQAQLTEAQAHREALRELVKMFRKCGAAHRERARDVQDEAIAETWDCAAASLEDQLKRAALLAEAPKAGKAVDAVARCSGDGQDRL